MPVLRTPFWGDDEPNSQRAATLSYFQMRALRYVWNSTSDWIRSEGRFFPVSAFENVFIFTNVGSRWSYKLISVAAIVMCALAVGWLFRLLVNARGMMLLGVMCSFETTLTIPGIAGIVLTIGMAVDANVLIYERIREEVRNGKSTFAAMEAGFRRAYATILDSNLTHLISAVVLYAVGTGPIRGFAVAAGIGVATTLFTQALVSRYMLVWWLRARRPKTLPI